MVNIIFCLPMVSVNITRITPENLLNKFRNVALLKLGVHEEFSGVMRINLNTYISNHYSYHDYKCENTVFPCKSFSTFSYGLS
jgi:hypothetical protein